MARSPLERITERVNQNGNVNDPATPRPLLTLSEFFEGNNVVGSIGCNLMPEVHPAELYDVLRQIAARPEVADVRVQVTMFDVPEWPFSDTVWVITSANAEAVAEWFPERPSGLNAGEGWTDGVKFEPCEVPRGMSAVSCWWD